MSAASLVLGRLGKKPSQAKGKKKSKSRSRSAAPSTEYNMLLTATLCLLAFGAVMVFSASSTTQVLSDGDLSNSTSFLKKTVMFGAVGLLIMHVVARTGLGFLRKTTPLLLGGSLFLLLAVLVVGTTVNGSTRWIAAAGFQLQPSELAKVALVLYGAHLFASEPKQARTIAGMMPFLLVVGFACLLVVMEPDLGTALVTVFAVTAVLVAAGARFRDLLLIAAVIGFVALLATVAEPYRRERLIGFLNPGVDATGSGFQALQAKIALGSGGIFGVGIGDGVQKAFYLPEAHTDMIAAVVGEEFGLIGIAAIVGLFALFGYAGLRIAQHAKDSYGKLLAGGLTSLILVQATVNLFAVMGMAPLTGVPLPLVSYGNSSMLVSLFAVGLILNVARGGTASAAGSRRPRAGKLRVVDGGRSPARRRSGKSRASSRQSGSSRRGNSRTRRAGHGRRRRASG